ncbi:MAG: hypothetical protein HY751_09960 [Nitrospinae bacterium]|nr:hypothetical protein [Nitrospinota bacterium]
MKKAVFPLLAAFIALCAVDSLAQPMGRGRGGMARGGNVNYDYLLSSPTTMENADERFQAVSNWAFSLREKGVHLREVFDQNDMMRIRGLLQSDRAMAVKEIDASIKRLAGVAGVSTPAGPGLGQSAMGRQYPTAPVTLSIPYPYAGYYIMPLVNDPADGAIMAGLNRGILTVTLHGSPAIVTQDPLEKSKDPALRNQSFGFLADDLDAATRHTPELNFGWVKLSGLKGANWSVYLHGAPGMETGEAYLESIRRNAEKAAQAGLNVLLIIEPMQEKKRTKVATSIDMKTRRVAFQDHQSEEYTNFLRKLFAKLPMVKYYSLGNEADNYMAAEDYARALKVTYDTLKESCPACSLVTSGYLNDNGAAYFEQALAALKGKRAFDHFDMRHVFGYYGEYRRIKEEYRAARNMLDRYGYRDAEIWMTETASPSAMSGDPNTSDAAQAADVVRRYVTAYAAGVKKVFWAAVTDHYMFGGRHGFFDSAGIIHNPANDGRADLKPAYHTYALMARTLAGANLATAERVEVGPSAECYRVMKDGKPFYFMWPTVR